jgi:adenylosuccinate synthase
MLALESAVTTAEKGCSRGKLVGLKRAWPSSVGCGHDKTEVLEKVGAATEEEGGTAGATEKEAACGWDEKSIAERRESVLICLGL